MRNSPLVATGVLAVAALTGACADHNLTDPTGPRQLGPANATVEVCETVDFEGAAHGTSPSPITVFGQSISVTGTIFVAADGNPAAGAVTPVVFNTEITDVVEDDDLQQPPTGDCQDCADLDLGNILILPDVEQNTGGSFFFGDYRWGGTMVLSGFSGSDFYVKSFAAVDDDGGVNAEPFIELYADGTTLIGASSNAGDAEVEIVDTDETTTFTNSLLFKLGTEVQDFKTGSGGVDDIVICRQEEVPPPSNPGTGTPGYWKNHPDAWPVDNITIGGVSYTKDAAIDGMNAPTHGDKTYNMFEQLVAATLNVLIGNDPSCISGTITDANEWLADNPLGSGVKANSDAWQDPTADYPSGSDLHGTLDAYNNGNLCAPSRDD